MRAEDVILLALRDEMEIVRAYTKTFSGRFQTNEGKALIALHLRLLERLTADGVVSTPMPGQPNP